MRSNGEDKVCREKVARDRILAALESAEKVRIKRGFWDRTVVLGVHDASADPGFRHTLLSLAD
jgi:hypothetical protein